MTANWKMRTLAAATAIVLCTTIGALAQTLAPGVGEDGSITVPKDDYRKDWSYLGAFSVLGEEGAAELHVVYTQPASVEAYRETGQFPDGTVLVKELYEGASDDLTTGRVSWSGKSAGWFVMVKDSQDRFPGNSLWGDGWGWAFFEAGAPDTPVTVDYRDECLACHEPARDTGLVYIRGYPSLTGKGR
jgi:hypothetical protein